MSKRDAKKYKEFLAKDPVRASIGDCCRQIFELYQMLEPHKSYRGTIGIGDGEGICIMVFKATEEECHKVKKFLESMNP